MQSRRLILVLALAAIAVAPSLARAQLEANLGKYTGENAEGYLEPVKEGFGAALQAGTHRSAWIDPDRWQVGVDVKTMFVKFSDDDRTFMARTGEAFLPVTEVEAPTAIGSTEAVTYTGSGGATAVFPGGFDVGSLALAVPQLTVGFPSGSQVLLRFIAVETGDADFGEISLLGLGARHSISQYIQDSPVDVAASLLWQTFTVGDDLIEADAFSFGVQASKRYSVLEPYVGISLDSFAMSVDYEYGTEDPPEELSVDFDRDTNPHFLAGLGVNLSVVHLYGEIGHSSQTSFALGLSVGN